MGIAIESKLPGELGGGKNVLSQARKVAVKYSAVARTDDYNFMVLLY